jgi:phosphoglycerate kinase
MSLRPVATRLGELLGQEVAFADDCIGDAARELAEGLSDGQVGLLENLRYHEGETKGDRAFAEALAAPCELYVNDAFGTAHRAHASVVGVPEVLGNGAAGLLMDSEIQALGKLLESPERPYVAILGGAKVSDKIELIEKLLERVDTILVGGAMAYTFLVAQGVEVGDSLVEKDKIGLAEELLERAERKGVAIELPRDHVTATSIGKREVSGLGRAPDRAIPAGQAGVDVGPGTLEAWLGMLGDDVKTILWNGPVGLFEAPGADAGTRAIAARLAKAPAFVVIGGGDTAAAAAHFEDAASFDHVSTGGGAALEFLSGVTLPGVSALER